MKKMNVALIVLCLAGATVFAQTTLSNLAETTGGLVTNAIDWTAGPNDQFNLLENNYFLGGLDFTGTNIGYYKAGKMPLAIRTDFMLVNDLDPASQTVMGVDVTTSHPMFNAYDFLLSTTIGFPQVSNLSIGLDFSLSGDDDGFESEAGGASNEVVDKNGTLILGVPFGFSIGKMYNYGYVTFSRDFVEYDDDSVADDEIEESQVYFTLYDKLRMPSLIGKGTETAIWVYYQSPYKADVTIDNSYSNIGAGVSNRFDLDLAEGVTLILNPYFRTDARFTDNAPVDTTTTNLNPVLGMQTALTAKLGSSPFTLTAGVTPYLYFNWQKQTVDGAVESESYGYTLANAETHTALLCITADLPGEVQIDFQIINANSYAIECVIPLK